MISVGHISLQPALLWHLSIKHLSTWSLKAFDYKNKYTDTKKKNYLSDIKNVTCNDCNQNHNHEINKISYTLACAFTMSRDI